MMSEEELKAYQDQMVADLRRTHPRPIAWDEVQKDDTIRAENVSGLVRVVCGKVGYADDAGVQIKDNKDVRWIYSSDGWSLTLIDRSEPERPAGSLWWHRGTGAGFVRTDAQNPVYSHYVGFTGEHRAIVVRGDYTGQIAELIPWAERPDAAGDPS